MKREFPASQAKAAASEIVDFLSPNCERIEVAGSLRRRRDPVGDVEIVLVPRLEAHHIRGDLFLPSPPIDLAESAIKVLLITGLLTKRLNVNGAESWGKSNKLAVHAPSGIPVDLFSTTEECWHNYLVCRTGGSATNVRICNAAIARGWHWKPYGHGFSRMGDDGLEFRAIGSEREVFEFVGLPYLEPWER